MRQTKLVQLSKALGGFSLAVCISLALAPAAQATSLTWTTNANVSNTDGGGTWSDGSGASGAGWNTSGGAGTAWSSTTPDSATIGVNNGVAGTINVLNNAGNSNIPVTIGSSLIFNPASSGTYLISDSGSNTNTIKFNNTTITNNADAKIAVDLAAGSSFTKNGAGQLNYTMGTGYTIASVFANNVTIAANNGTLLMGDATNNGPKYSASAAANTNVILGGATMRFNNVGQPTTPGNFSFANFTMNAGASAITQVNNASARFQILTSLTRNVGSTLVYTASATSGQGGWLVGNSLPLDQTTANQWSVPGYFINVNSAGLSNTNGRGNVDVGVTATATGNIQSNATSYFLINNTVAQAEANLTSDSEAFVYGGNAFIGAGAGAPNATGFTTFTANHSVRGLKLASNTVNSFLDLGGFNVAIEGGGLYFANFASNNQNYTIKDSVGGGALHGGYGATRSAAGTTGVADLIIYQGSTNSTSLTISAVIADNTSGVSSGVVVPVGFTAQPTGLTKSGPGLLILSGLNSYTGANYLNQGVTSISDNANLGAPATGATINLSGGTLLSTANVSLDNASLNKRSITIADKGGVLAADSTHTLTVSGVISSLSGVTTAPVTFGVATSGTGTVAVNGINTYTGTTNVAAGRLLVGDSVANNTAFIGPAATTVQPGATIGGYGTVGGNLSILAGGFVAPGASIGTLSVLGNTAITGTYNVDFDDTGAGSIDLLAVTGSLTLNSATVNFNQLANAADDPAYIFATYGSLVGNPFLTVTNLPAGYQIDYNYLGNNDIALVAVPEPASLVLMCLGAGAMGFVGIRRRRSA